MPKRFLLVLPVVALLVGATRATPPRFSTPYDIVGASNGDLYFTDGLSGRVLRYEVRRRRLSLYARIRGNHELVGISRTAKGTLYVSDIRQGIIWKIDVRRRVSRFVRIAGATDSVLRGRTLYVGSLERGVYAVDLRTRRRRLVDRRSRPHGLTSDATGALVVADAPNGIFRVDVRTGARTLVLGVDSGRAAFARDGRLYFAQGSPEGGVVRRLEPDGRITTVAGTGKIGPDGEGVPATSVGLQITAFLFARDSSLLIGQSLPRPAKIRRVNLSTGIITTLVRSR